MSIFRNRAPTLMTYPSLTPQEKWTRALKVHRLQKVARANKFLILLRVDQKSHQLSRIRIKTEMRRKFSNKCAVT